MDQFAALDPKHARDHLIAARARLDALTADVGGAQLFGPKIEIVNPFLWELGHVAWFQERWCLRVADGSLGASILDGADALYDSSAVAHWTRWHLPLASLAETRRYLAEVLNRTLESLDSRGNDPRQIYFAELSAAHEDMHCEAFHYMRQTLSYPAPGLGDRGETKESVPMSGDARFAGGEFLLGALPGNGFVHDNEKWAHPVRVAPFAMARTSVINEQFREFVEAGGYARREFWSDDGWRWRTTTGYEAPRYWRVVPGGWEQRRFDRWVPLALDEPVLHVNWFEADAYCRFAGRRLPTEAEWEFAAQGGAEKRVFPWGNAALDAGRANLESASLAPVTALAEGDTPEGVRQLMGNVWEWTASDFLPYPGFKPDPYEDYSQPWFGTRKVLRGGSFASPRRMLRATWRNFFTPDRADVFAGLRTCALEA